MRNLLVAALALTMFSGVAVADRGGHKGDRHDRRPSVREHRKSQPPRANRPARRANRKALDRRAVHSSEGRFVFADGRSRTYRRPVIRTHYRNAAVRPRLIVESYPREPGYIWVRGGWTWVGAEWQWSGGHYAPDPQYSTYYDDGSYDYSLSITIGG